ncbi:PEP-CTERM sorting domain-containing protein [Agarivorans sp. B2Z047]|uniref:exosortase-dependent surface protein XDP1 n=1 Tax=Agarivorans sp. B2Z047 TaxID=2652721 RepID=UPI00128CE873|nr:exosortase-dependent surface protein XDP1 [Agarivorans sp. B2Z047]MPW29134.1 PEP-CTERM sorting domain-containing protein [Agarivorans sp. B2Z047]UQN41687.1 PEP-CTERM sorting domain-containing protein [Agarivorans sp. B2Z047]
MFKQILLVASCAVSLSAFSAEQVWDFDDGTLNGGNRNGYGNTLDLDGLSVQGWSDTGRPADSTLRTTKLTYSSNWGLMSYNRDNESGTPQHSIDSYGNDFDMVLLSFDEAVNLAGFTLGWASEDYGTNSQSSHADVSVLAYSGNDAPALYNNTWADLAGLGWTTEAEVSNADEFAYQAIDSSAASKYWLIGAYNPIFGSLGWSSGNDGFKLAGVSTNSPQVPVTSVPEPGTVLLFAAGLFGIALRSRKRQA